MRLRNFVREGALEVHPAGQHTDLPGAGNVLVGMIADVECLLGRDS
ncbi:hypothetical protein Enr10x_06230 [Gimesia panareensis]|uniref:Uncharacterized protein n=1 Tax=Gimesia panareensis TaxID=2527978 RepID=A0A517Q110_9PLAN|nr:hypothetical protein Enr10x_06230 [Gimesia panareensis]